MCMQGVSTEQLPNALGTLFVRMNWQRAAILYRPREGIVDYVSGLVPYNVTVFSASIPATPTSATIRQALRFIQLSEVKIIIFDDGPTITQQILTEMNALGMLGKYQLLGVGWTSNALLFLLNSATKAAMENMIGVKAYEPPATDPTYAAFTANILAFDPTNTPVTVNDVFAYETAMTYAQATKAVIAAGLPVTAANVAAVLRSAAANVPVNVPLLPLT